MNLEDLFTGDRLLQTKKIAAAAEGVTAIQIKAGGHLKEHVTPIPAILFCIKGEVIFENEKGIKETLLPGDFINIEPRIKHRLTANTNGILLLVK